jgi:hypothetical protein
MSAITLATVAALPGPGADAGDGPPVTAGVPVEFHDRSSGLPTTWEWDFDYNFLVPTPDSTQQNPTWTYTDPGTFAVRLQVCNALGCDVRIRFIDVLPGDGPPAEIFADGFESGDLSRWSGVVP